MGKIDLEELYGEIATAVAKVDFSMLWEGFRPLKFALYNDEECFFDGRYVEKTADFCANTAIKYDGDVIAIWRVENRLETSVFASKIIHEMFHAFQEKEGWDCFPNEKEAPFRYVYSKENLTLKLRENRLLQGLLDRFDPQRYEELLRCRKYRSERFPYEFQYECGNEEIEGSANYVEWQVLKQLDEKKADELVADMRDFMVSSEFFFPIRITGYYTGALMIHAMVQAGEYSYGAKDRPVIDRLLKKLPSVDSMDPGMEEDVTMMSEAVDSYLSETKRIVESVVAKNNVVLRGPVSLGSVNIGDARFYEGYLTSRFFVMYLEEGEKKVIRGDYVVKMKDEETIDTIYRWDRE